MRSFPDANAFEKHYRIGDLARLWGLGRETVRKLVKDDPGVIKIRMGRRKCAQELGASSRHPWGN